ncbi:MAG: hypothetical protein KQJ78_20180 [Deltaproteobacteria bacterium]|nr:hypothetical protein [Deltaproteobacteria bacterium]
MNLPAARRRLQLGRKWAQVRAVVVRPAFRLLLLIFGLLLLYWPFLTGKQGWSVQGYYYFLLIAWAIMVFLAAFSGLCEEDRELEAPYTWDEP